MIKLWFHAMPAFGYESAVHAVSVAWLVVWRVRVQARAGMCKFAAIALAKCTANVHSDTHMGSGAKASCMYIPSTIYKYHKYNFTVLFVCCVQTYPLVFYAQNDMFKCACSPVLVCRIAESLSRPPPLPFVPCARHGSDRRPARHWYWSTRAPDEFNMQSVGSHYNVGPTTNCKNFEFLWNRKAPTRSSRFLLLLAHIICTKMLFSSYTGYG